MEELCLGYSLCRMHNLVADLWRYSIRQEGIGLDAINDAFLLEGSIYRLLRRHCRGQPYYVHLLELFTEVEKPSQITHYKHVCLFQSC